MKFKLRPKVNGLAFNNLDRLLLNRGIKDIELYKNPQFKIPNFENIVNFNEGINLFLKNVKSKTLIVVDSDTDGYTSSTIMWQTIKRFFPNMEIDFYVHPKKEHGITLGVKEKVLSEGFKFLIVPDAGTNDLENSVILWENGCQILIIDHHELEVQNKFATIINNMQDGTNKQYTGASMTFLFCWGLAEKIGKEPPIDLIDLAAIGNVADSAILVSNEIRSLCLNGLNNISNIFIKKLMIHKNITNNFLTMVDVGWKIAPFINSVCRSGSKEEKELLFKALNNIHNNETYVVEKRKLNKETRKYEKIPFVLDFYENAIEILDKCKKNQDDVLAPIVKKQLTKVNPDRNIQVFILDKNDDAKSSTGLIANKLQSEIKQPVIVLWEKENTFTGSARGNTNVIKNFKDFCSKTEMFKLTQGHDNAFGVIIEKENLLNFIDYISKIELTMNEEANEHIVDEIFENGFVDRKLIEEVANCDKTLWCNGCPEPTFGITKLIVKKEEVKFYRGGVMRLYANGMTYIKYFAKSIEKENFEVGFGDKIEINILCKFENNEYNGRVTQQGIIIDYEVKEHNDFKIEEPKINNTNVDVSILNEAMSIFG